MDRSVRVGFDIEDGVTKMSKEEVQEVLDRKVREGVLEVTMKNGVEQYRCNKKCPFCGSGQTWLKTSKKMWCQNCGKEF